MTPEERDALVEAFQQPTYAQVGPWAFEYIYPGYFAYTHPSQGLIYFTPDENELGMVSIELVDIDGEHQGSGLIPFTSMRAEDLFAIVQPFLRPRGGRKSWDPREAALGASAPQSSEKELAQELQSYMSRHDSFAGESYEFNIRIGAVDLPQEISRNVSQNNIDDIVQLEMGFQLRGFAAELKREFPWIYT